jgi:hypothetical protein
LAAVAEAQHDTDDLATPLKGETNRPLYHKDNSIKKMTTGQQLEEQIIK